MDTLYTFWDKIAHYKTESVHFMGLMNSATKGNLNTYRFKDLYKEITLNGRFFGVHVNTTPAFEVT